MEGWNNGLFVGTLKVEQAEISKAVKVIAPHPCRTLTHAYTPSHTQSITHTNWHLVHFFTFNTGVFHIKTIKIPDSLSQWDERREIWSSANLQYSEGTGLVLVGAQQSQRAPQFHQTSENTHNKTSEAFIIFLPTITTHRLGTRRNAVRVSSLYFKTSKSNAAPTWWL